MMNETITQTSKLLSIDFQTWTNVTTAPLFIISMLVVWFIPMLIYIIVGCVVGGKSASGYSKKMIEYANFFYAPLIWTFIFWLLVLILIIFPLPLKLLT